MDLRNNDITMMKKITTIVGMSLLALSFAACSGEDTAASTGLSADNQIALTATIAADYDAGYAAGAPGAASGLDALTRAAQWSGFTAEGTQFAAGQTISLYMPGALSASGTALESTHSPLAATVTDGQRLLSFGAYYWPLTAEGGLTFYALYPDGLATGSRTASYPFAVSGAQGGVEGAVLQSPSGKSADVLYATTTVSRRSEQPVPLTFLHRMSKVSLVLNPDADMLPSHLESCSVSLGDVYRGATLAMSDGTVTAVTASGTGYVAPDPVTVKAGTTGDSSTDNTSLSNYCLLPPGQNLAGRTVTVTLSDGSALSYIIPQRDSDGDTTPDDILLRGGCHYRLTLDVSATKLTLRSLVIEPWTDVLYGEDGLYVIDYALLPLTVEMQEAGTLNAVNSSGNTYEYRMFSAVNNTWSGWQVLPASVSGLSTGDKVQLRGTAEPGSDLSHLLTLTSTARHTVYGNVMSLVVGSDLTAPAPAPAPAPSRRVASPTTLTNNYAFARLFQGDTGLTNASSLLLPATTLKPYCYYEMFRGCTGLLRVPALPATTLAQECYRGMFRDCASLSVAPVLLAGTLAEGCYREMLQGCTSLTVAPDLPAATLMPHCYRDLLNGCTSLATASDLPAATLAEGCYYGLYQGCTSLEKAPMLLALTLARSSYQQMFQGCTSLNEVHCAATDISATNCTTNWLASVSTTGAFYGERSTLWKEGGSGIPPTWENDILEKPRDKPLTFEATGANAQVAFTNNGSTADGYKYRTAAAGADWGDWASYTLGTVITLANVGDRVQFIGNQEPGSGSSKYIRFVSSSVGNLKVYGNVMSLKSGLDGSGDYSEAFKTDNTITNNYAFANLFNGNTKITDISQLVLPAISLVTGCYYCMFRGCTGLTGALPEGLLPATTLTPYCYFRMFEGCTGITQTPRLNATALVDYCYQAMFRNCSELSTVYCYASSGINTSSSTYKWLDGVAASGTFYKNASAGATSGGSDTNWPLNDEDGIPSGWTLDSYTP